MTRDRDFSNHLSGPEFDDLVTKYHQYFTKLYNVKPENDNNNGGATLFKSFLNGKYRDLYVSEFVNAPFTEKEVYDCASSLKNGKSAGIDKVLNEFIRIGRSHLAKPIAKIFNPILSSGYYPSLWSVNILSTIHKGGPKDCLDNYRGISV